MDLYTRQSEEQQRQLERQGRAKADAAYSTMASVGQAASGAVEGYQRGQKHKREGELQAKNMELSEEQLATSRGTRGAMEKEQALLDAVDPATHLSGRQRRFGNEMATSEESLAGARAGRKFTERQTAMLGEKTPAEKTAEAQAEIDRALYAAQGAKTPEERERAEGYARSKMAAAGLSEAAIAVRMSEQAAKYGATQKSAATAANLAATTAPGYAEITPQLAEQELKAAQLESQVGALEPFEKASVLGGGENVPRAQLTAGMDETKRGRINESMLTNPLAGTQSGRAREILVSDATQLEQSLASLRSRAVDHPTLQPRVRALENQLSIIQAKLNGPRVGQVIDGHRFIGGDPHEPSSWEQTGVNGGPMMNVNFGG